MDTPPSAQVDIFFTPPPEPSSLTGTCVSRDNVLDRDDSSSGEGEG